MGTPTIDRRWFWGTFREVSLAAAFPMLYPCYLPEAEEFLTGGTKHGPCEIVVGIPAISG